MLSELELKNVIETISKKYSPLSENCLYDLFQCSKFLDLKKSTLLVKEGQYADKAYFIIKGSARAFYLKDGKDITDWFAFEDDFISSINSFFLDVPSPHFIEVMESAVMMEVSKKNTLALADKYHDFERLQNKIVTRTMLQLQHRIASVQFETAQQKFDNLLKIRPDIANRVQLTHIASYLGITLETLSRIRNPKNRI